MENGRNLLDLSPATGSVVGGDLDKQGGRGWGGDAAAGAEGDGTGRLVAVPAGDDAVCIGHDRAVVEEQVDVVLGGEQRAHVAVEDEVGPHPALDRLLDAGICGVDYLAQFAAQAGLPGGQGLDIGVHARIVARAVQGLTSTISKALRSWPGGRRSSATRTPPALLPAHAIPALDITCP